MEESKKEKSSSTQKISNAQTLENQTTKERKPFFRLQTFPWIASALILLISSTTLLFINYKSKICENICDPCNTENNPEVLGHKTPQEEYTLEESESSEDDQEKINKQGKNLKLINGNDWDKEVAESTEPALVLFFEPWCSFCKMFMGVFNDLSEEMEGKVKFVKVNTQENSSVKTSQKIEAFPTVKLFKDGKEIDSFMGYREKEEVVKFLNTSL